MSDLKIGICGHFGGMREFLDGQTIKTKIITEELGKRFPDAQILTADTCGGFKALPVCLKRLLGFLYSCGHVIILPAHKSVRVFSPYLVLCNSFFKKRLHYIVIGGWLPNFLRNKPILRKCLKQFDYIYVETNVMRDLLERQGFDNLVVMPNCKPLTIVSESELFSLQKEPYKLCIFSRIMREKGIEDAVYSVKAVNKKLGRVVYELDLYGQVDSRQTEWFETLQEDFDASIRYCGSVPFDRSVNVLKTYFALLFPTKFYTEGVPGSIIDAYAAGIPVIASRWESFADVVEENVTGIGYPFLERNELEHILYKTALQPQILYQMKKNCVLKAEEFMPERVIDKIHIQAVSGVGKE